MGKEYAWSRALVLFCPELLMNITRLFLALGNRVLCKTHDFYLRLVEYGLVKYWLYGKSFNNQTYT